MLQMWANYNQKTGTPLVNSSKHMLKFNWSLFSTSMSSIHRRKSPDARRKIGEDRLLVHLSWNNDFLVAELVA